MVVISVIYNILKKIVNIKSGSLIGPGDSDSHAGEPQHFGRCSSLRAYGLSELTSCLETYMKLLEGT